MILVRQGVSGFRVLQSHSRDYIASVSLFNVLSLIRVHFQEASDPLFLSGINIVDCGP